METRDQQLDEEQLRTMSTLELVQHALVEARLLARAEVLCAKRELKQELAQAKHLLILGSLAVVLLASGLALVSVALALVLPLAGPLGALAVGGVLLVAAAGVAVAAYQAIPKAPLAKTTERLRRDVAVARQELG